MRAPIATLLAAVAVAAGIGLAAPGSVAEVGEPGVWQQRRPLNIAHAGGDLEAPHETMFAYEEAVAAGADVLELDVRMSADGVLMVIHDDTVDRTSNATGAVRDLTAAQLGALDNAYWFVPGCWSCHDRPPEEYSLRGVRTGERPPPEGHEPSDFGVPTLREVFERFPDRLLDIEIKDGPDGLAAADALAALLGEYGRAERVMVVSFDDAIMAHFRAIAPEVATAPGLGGVTDWFLSRGPLPYASLQVPPVYSGIEVVSAQLVADAHAQGAAVWVWFNGNDDDVASEWGRLLDLGVDGLITGKPRQLQAFLDARWAGFYTPIEVTGPLAVHPVPRLPVRCPAAAADRCRAVVGIVGFVGRHGEAVVLALGPVDLAPGASADVELARQRGPHAWRRAKHARTIAMMWPIGGDTAAGAVPVALTR